MDQSFQAPLQLATAKGTRYYTVLDVIPQHGATPAPLSRKPGAACYNVVVVFAGMVGVALVCIGAVGLSADISRLTTNLRWTTLDLEASQGSNVAQAGVEVGEYSKRWHGQVTGKAFPGVWKTGLSRETGQPVVQNAEVTIKEGMAAIKLGLTKTAGSVVNMGWKSSVETSNEYSYGGAMGGRFQPVIVGANIGTREGDTVMTTGIITDGRQYKFRAGAEGRKDDHKWKLELQSGTRSNPIIWKANVVTDKTFDLQKPVSGTYSPDAVGVKQPQRKGGKAYNTDTYMGEEASFPNEY